MSEPLPKGFDMSRLSLLLASVLLGVIALTALPREARLAQVSMTPRPDEVTPPAMQTIGSQAPTPARP